VLASFFENEIRFSILSTIKKASAYALAFKVFDQTFFKKFVGFGATPQGFISLIF